MLKIAAAALALLIATAGMGIAKPVVHHRPVKHAHRAAKPVDHSPTVWVNTDTGIFHMPGERWYGRTKDGEYMSEKQALADGYRETENGQ